MSNFKVGDTVVCNTTFDMPLIKRGQEVIVTDIKTCKCGRTGICWGDSVPSGFAGCGCNTCGVEFSCSMVYLATKYFDRPTTHHSKSTIKNQSVLKRLATLPQVTERIEIPVRKQEGVNV